MSPSEEELPIRCHYQGGSRYKAFFIGMSKSYTEIPDGCSLIISGCQKPLPHEAVNSEFIILDPFGGKWTSPQVFNVWQEEVEMKVIKDDKLKTHQIALFTAVTNSSSLIQTGKPNTVR